MRVLLDTHVVLWALADSDRLSARARALLADADNEFWVSSASVWEIAIKILLGKYEHGQPLAPQPDTSYGPGDSIVPTWSAHL